MRSSNPFLDFSGFQRRGDDGRQNVKNSTGTSVEISKGQGIRVASVADGGTAIGRLRIKDYELLRLIGWGAFGKVLYYLLGPLIMPVQFAQDFRPRSDFDYFSLEKKGLRNAKSRQWIKAGDSSNENDRYRQGPHPNRCGMHRKRDPGRNFNSFPNNNGIVPVDLFNFIYYFLKF